MDKGWGLTLESDPIKLFSNSYNHNKKGNTSMFSGFGFPVNLSCKEEDQSGSRPSDENRTVVNEVDFFSDRFKSSAMDDDSNTNTSGASISVKKENLDVNTGLHLANTRSDQSSTVDDEISPNAENRKAKNQLVRLQAELERMNVENQRLRGMLSEVTNNYTALHSHLVTLTHHNSRPETTPDHHHEPRQFLELGPRGTTPSPPSAGAETNEQQQQQSYSTSDERTHSGSPPRNINNNVNGRKEIVHVYDQDKATGKSVGREESPESEGWGPNKVPKLNGNSKALEQGTSAEATMRKARVSVRARSEAPMITDGCQWRKYGQKMAKGNPCPRAYYRCTMAVGCPVRKQVQRCAEDRTVLITTYEGNHNHPLPPAAMAMASTTSAAASMLLSGSMPSADGLMNPNLLARAILPCSTSMATISASAPFPTVTLDLTHTPSPLQFQRPPTPFQIPFPNQPQNPNLPQIFSQVLHNQSKFSGLHVSNNSDSSQLAHQQQHPSLADSVTAAITADPNFTAALAAAITSIMGGGNGNTNATTGTSNSSMSNSFQK